MSAGAVICDRCRGICRPADMVKIRLRFTRVQWPDGVRKLHYHPACWDHMSSNAPEGIIWDADGVLRAEGKRA